MRARPSQPFKHASHVKTKLTPGSFALRAKVKGFRCLGCFTKLALTSLSFSNLLGGGVCVFFVFYTKTLKTRLPSGGMVFTKTGLLLVRFLGWFLVIFQPLGTFRLKSGVFGGFFLHF